MQAEDGRIAPRQRRAEQRREEECRFSFVLVLHLFTLCFRSLHTCQNNVQLIISLQSVHCKHTQDTVFIHSQSQTLNEVESPAWGWGTTFVWFTGSRPSYNLKGSYSSLIGLLSKYNNLLGMHLWCDVFFLFICMKCFRKRVQSFCISRQCCHQAASLVIPSVRQSDSQQTNSSPLCLPFPHPFF